MTTTQSTLRLTLLDEISNRARGINAALNGLERQATSFGAPFRSLIGQAIAFGGTYLGVTEGINKTAGAAIGFESAFADVRKVVDANEEQFENMRRTIRQMSTELPIAATDIAALFAAAGESGIATNDLKAFAEMAARVGIAFDMTAGDAGESLAKLKTQLGLTVAETGDMADAINHLSNNMASKAKDITAYMLRVGALAEMGGFTKEEIAGIGSAMIASGAEAEVAATAMQNVVKALTRGASAKKSQQDVAKALGLDLPTIAKDMQKDAPKALRKVLAAIGKAPKDRHLALLSDFFGDEAKAFAPLIGNMGLLEQALDSVSDRTKYSGSAFNEYVERANTTGNVLSILGNKVSDVFLGMGESMLPSIKDAALGINDILDTLDDRVSIFDEIQTSIQGFANGLGYGDVREVIDGLGDLIFGKIDPEAGDKIGRIFMEAKQWGVAIRDLNEAIKENPIAQFFADIAPYGFQIMLWGAGLAMLAGTIRSLASAMMLLSGASTILAALRAAGTIAGIVGGGAVPTAGAAAAGAAGTAAAGVGGGAATKLLGIGRMGVFGAALAGLWHAGKEAYTGDTLYSRGESFIPGPTDVLHAIGSKLSEIDSKLSVIPSQPGIAAQMALDAARGARQFGIGGNTTDTLPGKTADDLDIGKPISLDAASIDALLQPRGVQDVNITNPRPAPNINLTVSMSVTGVTNPQEIADQVVNRVGQQLRQEVAGIYADTGYGVA